MYWIKIIAYGKNSIINAFKIVNARIPENFQNKDNATVHSGRRSLTTNAINKGVDFHVVAAATKDRDPRALDRYLKPDDNLLGQAISSYCDKENYIAGEKLILKALRKID